MCPVLGTVPLVPCLGLDWQEDEEMNEWTRDYSVVSILESTVPFHNPRLMSWARFRDSLPHSASLSTLEQPMWASSHHPEDGKQPGHTGEKLGWPDGTMTGPGHRLSTATGYWGNCSARLLSEQRPHEHHDN